MKYFRISYEEILWGRSWANLVMLSATIPSFDDDKNEPIQKIDEENVEDFFGF